MDNTNQQTLKNGEHIHKAGYATAQPRGFRKVSPGRMFTFGGLNRCEGRAILSCDRITSRYGNQINQTCQ